MSGTGENALLAWNVRRLTDILQELAGVDCGRDGAIASTRGACARWTISR